MAKKVGRNFFASTIAKRSTWKDVGAGAVGGIAQSLGASILGATLGTLASAILIGAMPNKFVFDDINKTAFIVNKVSDAMTNLLVGA